MLPIVFVHVYVSLYGHNLFKYHCCEDILLNSYYINVNRETP